MRSIHPWSFITIASIVLEICSGQRMGDAARPPTTGDNIIRPVFDGRMKMEKTLLPSINFLFSMFSILSNPEILFWAHLTLSQTTNFRFFQTERVCRQQFQIWRKWQKVLHTGRKHCRKKRNCSLWAISPFPTVFSKDLYCRHVKTRACLGKG